MNDLIWQTLERDEFTCKLCGKRNLSLKVDFILNPKFGGSIDINNTITLCYKCNVSDKIFYDVLDMYGSVFRNTLFTPKVRKAITKIIDRIGSEEVFESMRIALDKNLDDESTVKYFFGICWNKINNSNIYRP